MRLEDSRIFSEILPRLLGTTLRGLREVPATVLMNAWERVFSGSPAAREVDGRHEFRSPVVDGRWVFGFDHELPTPDVPMLIVHTRTEGSFCTGPYPPQPRPTPPPPNDAEMRAAAHPVREPYFGTPREAASPFFFGTPREAASPFFFGTPREAASPFFFGTCGIPALLFETHRLPKNVPLFDNGPLEKSVSGTFINLLASFARNGVPCSANVPEWQVFSPDRPTTMVSGGEHVAVVATTSNLRQLRFWDDAEWVPRCGDKYTYSDVELTVGACEAFGSSHPDEMRFTSWPQSVFSPHFLGHLRISFNGPSKEGERFLRPLREVYDPVLDTVTDMPSAKVATMHIHIDPTEPGAHYERSARLRTLDNSAVTTLGTLIKEALDAPFTGAPAKVEQAPMAQEYQQRLMDAMRPWHIGCLFLSFISAEKAP